MLKLSTLNIAGSQRSGNFRVENPLEALVVSLVGNLTSSLCQPPVSEQCTALPARDREERERQIRQREELRRQEELPLPSPRPRGARAPDPAARGAAPPGGAASRAGGPS